MGTRWKSWENVNEGMHEKGNGRSEVKVSRQHFLLFCSPTGHVRQFCFLLCEISTHRQQLLMTVEPWWSWAYCRTRPISLKSWREHLVIREQGVEAAQVSKTVQFTTPLLGTLHLLQGMFLGGATQERGQEDAMKRVWRDTIYIWILHMDSCQLWLLPTFIKCSCNVII